MLGGQIGYYTSAKAYTERKTRVPFPPQKNSLTSSQCHARLGTFIKYEESSNVRLYQDLLLRELLGEDIIYDEKIAIILKNLSAKPSMLNILLMA